jgi:hypothetical protein
VERIIIEVHQEGERWEVIEGGVGGELLGDFTRKIDALRLARRHAKESAPSKLIVRKKDGDVQEDRTYGPLDRVLELPSVEGLA